MYHLASVHKDHIDNHYKASGVKYDYVRKNAFIIFKTNPDILSMIIFNDCGEIIPLTLKTLINGSRTISTRLK